MCIWRNINCTTLWSIFSWVFLYLRLMTFEPPHDKTNKMTCAPSAQISLGICPVWSESLLSVWRKLGSLATHWVHNEDSDQTGQMPRLIWVFDGCIVILVLSWSGLFVWFLLTLFSALSTSSLLTKLSLSASNRMKICNKIQTSGMAFLSAFQFAVFLKVYKRED